MKLVVNIEPGWFHGVHQVEVELGDDYEDYDPEELETCMAEIAEDTFNENISYGWHVVDE
jgi:Zn finger protein HypA/HybF involved in hydrogenase expression